MKGQSGREVARQLTEFLRNPEADKEAFVDALMRTDRELQEECFWLFHLCMEDWADAYAKGEEDSPGQRARAVSYEMIHPSPREE